MKSLLLILGLGVAAVSLAALSCGDPVHDSEVAALGGEASGVPPGPTHRPGQPCLTCHGGLGPASEVFSTAGTIYETQYQSSIPAGSYPPLVGASVHLVDATGVATNPDPVTNSVGNFYVTLVQWNPVFPIGAPGPELDAGARDIQITAMDAGSAGSQAMTTQIARGGLYASCAYCHSDPPGPTSPGHVYRQSAP